MTTHQPESHLQLLIPHSKFLIDLHLNLSYKGIMLNIPGLTPPLQPNPQASKPPTKQTNILHRQPVPPGTGWLSNLHQNPNLLGGRFAARPSQLHPPPPQVRKKNVVSARFTIFLLNIFTFTVFLINLLKSRLSTKYCK